MTTNQNALSTILADARSNLTMSSLEIANLVESRHDSVKRTIDRLVDRGVISQPPMVVGIKSPSENSQPPLEVGIKSPNGIIAQGYRLDMRSTLIVVAQLNPEFTAAIVDRWATLEKAAIDGQLEMRSNLVIDAMMETPEYAKILDHAIKYVSKMAGKRHAVRMLSVYHDKRMQDGEMTPRELEACSLEFILKNVKQFMKLEVANDLRLANKPLKFLK